MYINLSAIVLSLYIPDKQHNVPSLPANLNLFLGKCVRPPGDLCIFAHPDPDNKNLLVLNSGLNT